jgi:hypothetical protein
MLNKSNNSIAGVNMSIDTKQKPKARSFVMVTFGRGTAELKRQFDDMVETEGHTNAGLALELIRESLMARRNQVKRAVSKRIS